MNQPVYSASQSLNAVRLILDFWLVFRIVCFRAIRARLCANRVVGIPRQASGTVKHVGSIVLYRWHFAQLAPQRRYLFPWGSKPIGQFGFNGLNQSSDEFEMSVVSHPLIRERRQFSEFLSRELNRMLLPMTPHYSVTQVARDQLDRAYRIIAKTGEWLQQSGRRQRISSTTMETYRRWQNTGSNYVVVRGDQFVGTFSLVSEPLSDWPQLEMTGNVIWLRALATDPDFRGQGVGKYAIQSALQIIGNENPLYLDCVSGFLPNYYMNHGFELIAEQTIEWHESGQMQISLLRHLNNSVDSK